MWAGSGVASRSVICVKDRVGTSHLVSAETECQYPAWKSSRLLRMVKYI